MNGYLQVPGLRIYGAPVFLHSSLGLFVGLCLIWAQGHGLYGLLAILCYLAIILIHEWGHAFIAHRLGLRVFAVQLGFFHGLCHFQKPADFLDEVKVAWGGVLAQFGVAALVLLPVPLLGTDLGYYGPLVIVLGFFNLLIACGNLLPARRLDGGRAWKIIGLLWSRRKRP
ncbi:hypothetical protein A9179_09740 [Pseudomonas alcaligenes]|uniref:Peptidase M50 domain-containing protein n=1 Tax=Aquipseudomonas alcaligenes TaxID=43263 RepID=A0ABR7S0C9_AQUAC|nr:hypothetical protein [Pseudomonas alcaligenes]MBC9250554.1 hypothetical protein [Pseudomonas alcaligenes]